MLTGKALKDRAAALEIPGRSTLKADELRAAIKHAERKEFFSDEVVHQLEETEREASQRAHYERYLNHDLSGLSFNQRTDNYERQNNGGKVRPGKQTRRLKHKYNKSLGF